MPVFAILECESLVQEKDKTRLDASKSFAAAVDDITSTTIVPSAHATEIILDEGVTHLDWSYDFKVDVTDENNRIDFNEGGSDLVATITNDSYTLALLAEEIEDRLNGAGANTYSVTVDERDRFIVTADAAFDLLPAGDNEDTSLLPEIGFPADEDDDAGEEYSDLLTYTGDEVTRVTKTVTVSVTNGTDQADSEFTLEVVSERADRLFSSDSDLRKHEPDILKFVPQGRATFKDIHRRSQQLMLEWLAGEGSLDAYGEKIIPRRFLDLDEVRDWSTYLTLSLIFDGLSNAVDDVFARKAERYLAMSVKRRDRAMLHLDLDQDGAADPSEGEGLDTRSARVYRR